MRSRTLAFVTVASITLASTFASAQEEPSSADVSAARALGQEGVKLADGGNCKEAIDKLARSEKLFHAPTTLERLGECQVQIGKIVDGSENLNKVARENISGSAPQAFRDAQDRAKRILAETKPKIAKLKIAVAGPADGNYTVKLDGESVPPANLNMNRPTDPGEHTVEASAPGYKTASARVSLAEGGTDSVALTLEIDPNAPKVVPVAPPPTAAGGTDTSMQTSTTTTTQPAGEKPSHVPAYIAGGVGIAGLAVGTIFGIVAISKKSSVQDQCVNTACPSKAQDDVDSGKTMGNISTVGFIVGGVGIAAGIVLYVLEGSSSSKTGSAKSRGFVGAQTAGFRF